MTQPPKKPYWDDETPIDRLWVDTVCRSSDMVGRHARVAVRWDARVRTVRGLSVYVNHILAPGIKTKGQFRKLCDALGVDLLSELDQ